MTKGPCFNGKVAKDNGGVMVLVRDDFTVIKEFWLNIRKECQRLSLTHWGRVTHICVSKSTIIGPDNGLSPGRRQVIIWTNAGILLMRPLGTNFNEMLIEILTFSFMKMRLKVSSAKWRPFCLGLNVLSYWVSLNPCRTTRLCILVTH